MICVIVDPFRYFTQFSDRLDQLSFLELLRAGDVHDGSFVADHHDIVVWALEHPQPVKISFHVDTLLHY